MRKDIVLLMLVLLGLVSMQRAGWLSTDRSERQVVAVDQLHYAFQNQLSGVQVEGAGTVIAMLKDDRDGSRHQRFIIKLSHGQTLLVSHNIDLAPRIDTLRIGDPVSFFGVYEWNDKGGVLHWTHHDPAGKHPGGWLKHNGRTYR